MALNEIKYESAEEELILSFYAYCGDFILCTEGLVETVMHQFFPKVEDAETVRICSHLLTKGYLEVQSRWGMPSYFAIRKEYELQCLIDLYENHLDDRVLLFDSLSLDVLSERRKSSAFRDWLLLELGFVKGNRYACPLLTDRQTAMMVDALDVPYWQNVAERLPYATWTECLGNCISKAFHQGTHLQWDNLKTLVLTHAKDDIPSVYGSLLPFEGQEDYFAFYYYLANGTTDRKKWGHNRWSELYNGVRSTYEGKYQEATSHFTNAVKEFGRTRTGERYIFDAYLFNYYYVLSLILDGSDKSVSRLRALQEKNIMKESFLYKNTLNTLIDYRLGGIPFLPSGDRIDGDTDSALVHRLAFSLLEYFDCHPTWNAQPTSWKMVETECTSADSILHRLKKQERWEIMLDNVDHRKLVDAPVHEERLIFVMNPQNMFVSPYIQRKDSRGEWKEMRRIWNGKQRDFPICATREDCKILSQMPEGETSFHGCQALMSFIGCNNLFLKQTKFMETLQQVEINMERPYLIVEQMPDGSYNILSNISAEELAQQSTSFVRRVDEVHYSLVQMYEWEYDIFRLMLSLGHLPASSADRLKTTLARLDGKIEIHSRLIHADELVLQADTRLLLRIHPYVRNGPFWRIHILTKPFPDSDLTAYPGAGDAISLMKIGGIMKEVCRNLQEEQNHLDLFVQQTKDLDIIYDDEDAHDVEDARVDLDNLLDIITWTNEHPDVAAVEIMDGCRFQVAAVAKPNHLKLELASLDMGWFKLEGRVNISADVQWSVAETIQKMEEGEGKYIRVDDHTFVRISKELRKIVTRLRAISKKMPDDHNFEVPAFAVATLDDSFDDVITTNSYDAVALRKKVKSCATWHAAVPETLNGELKPYQEIGYQWMARTLSWGAGVCLADDMGLGKTIQTIALLLLKASEGPSLVVAPTSVVFNWRNELQRFAPSLHVLVLNGADDRKEMVDEAVAGDVVVASYGMLFSQEPILTQKQWNVACLDEAHAIKNRTTKTAQAAMHLMAENRIVLTGTPVQNHFTDLWSLFHFINPGLLGNYQSFTERFSDEQNIEDCKSLAEELKGTVSPFILRRTKDEVLDELPGIDENIRYVELSPEELVIYDATRMAVKKKFEEKSRYDIYRRLSATGSQNVEVLAMLTKLRELACSNSLLIQGWQKRSSKEEAFMDLLHEIDLSYNHVLVFSQFTCFLQEIKDMLDEEGIDFLYLDGATPMKQREHLIDAFQSGATPIFLISLKAGGVGLNLTQASYVIHLDPWWNPAIEQQATDRAYRIGQNQHVSVFHLICRHTIEEKVLALQERKQAMSDTLLDTNGRSQGLSRDDILELLSD